MTETRLRELLAPFISPSLDRVLPTELYPRLLAYLELLLRWNERTNLTAIREPEEIVTRHFGESLFTAREFAGMLRPGDTLLDVGSGAGFPGLPIQLCFPALAVTLAESQGKKAAFLREVSRVLDAPVIVWAARVEDLPEERRFRWVTLRAVDRMDRAVAAAQARLAEGGLLLELAGSRSPAPDRMSLTGTPLLVPGSGARFLRRWHQDVP